MCGNWFYNELGGADENILIRNAVNAVAYLVYGDASLKLVAGTDAMGITVDFYSWLGVVALVIGTTIQLQDLKDYEGDKARGRRTAPVVLGTALTRVSVCMGVLLWSVVCPIYWQVSSGIVAVTLLAGLLLSARVMLCRGSKADRTSFITWSWWEMGIFLLPIFRA